MPVNKPKTLSVGSSTFWEYHVPSNNSHGEPIATPISALSLTTFNLAGRRSLLLNLCGGATERSATAYSGGS